MHLSIEVAREPDGRWLAEVPELPGVLTYGATAEEATIGPVVSEAQWVKVQRLIQLGIDQ